MDKYGNQRIIETMMQQQPQMNLAAPINDIQLVALMATQSKDASPADAVRWASDLLLEALKQAPDFHAKAKAAQQERLKTNGAH